MTEEYFYCGVLVGKTNSSKWIIAKLIVNSVVNQLQSVHRRVLFCKIHCEIKHNSLREYAVVIFSYFL